MAWRLPGNELVGIFRGGLPVDIVDLSSVGSHEGATDNPGGRRKIRGVEVITPSSIIAARLRCE